MLRNIGKQSGRISTVSPEVMHMHVLCVCRLILSYVLYSTSIFRPVSLNSSIVVCYNIIELTYLLTYLLMYMR